MDSNAHVLWILIWVSSLHCLGLVGRGGLPFIAFGSVSFAAIALKGSKSKVSKKILNKYGGQISLAKQNSVEQTELHVCNWFVIELRMKMKGEESYMHRVLWSKFKMTSPFPISIGLSHLPPPLSTNDEGYCSNIPLMGWRLPKAMIGQACWHSDHVSRPCRDENDNSHWDDRL